MGDLVGQHAVENSLRRADHLHLEVANRGRVVSRDPLSCQVVASHDTDGTGRWPRSAAGLPANESPDRVDTVSAASATAWASWGLGAVIRKFWVLWLAANAAATRGRKNIPAIASLHQEGSRDSASMPLHSID